MILNWILRQKLRHYRQMASNLNHSKFSTQQPLKAKNMYSVFRAIIANVLWKEKPNFTHDITQYTARVTHTSATFRNSHTRSIRARNFLYTSSASRQFFLFISKYFSKKHQIIMDVHLLTQTFRSDNSHSDSWQRDGITFCNSKHCIWDQITKLPACCHCPC